MTRGPGVARGSGLAGREGGVWTWLQSLPVAVQALPLGQGVRGHHGPQQRECWAGGGPVRGQLARGSVPVREPRSVIATRAEQLGSCC